MWRMFVVSFIPRTRFCLFKFGSGPVCGMALGFGQRFEQLNWLSLVEGFRLQAKIRTPQQCRFFEKEYRNEQDVHL